MFSRLRLIAGIYSIVVGISMFAVWGLYFANGTVFGVKPVGSGLGFHIAAELATAVAMLIGGMGLLARKSWGLKIYFLGLGMLIYALVNSPGYYLPQGGKIVIAVFASSGVFSLIFVALGLLIGNNETQR